MTSAAARPGPRHLLRRLITALVAVLIATLVVVVIALPVDLLLAEEVGADNMVPVLAEYLKLLSPVAAFAGLFGVIVGTVSRWLSGSSSGSVAAVSGVAAGAIPALATFSFLWALLVPALQVLWIVAIGVAAGWASWHADRRGRPQP